MHAHTHTRTQTSTEFHLVFKRMTWHFPLTRHLENALFVATTFAQVQMDFLHGNLFILKTRDEISVELENKVALLAYLQILADGNDTTPQCESAASVYKVEDFFIHRRVDL